MLSVVVVAAAAYLIGSVPFGYLMVRFIKRADVRETGSGGTGATNVARQAGQLAGLLTLLLDAAKGALAVALARTLLTPDFSDSWSVVLCALAAIVGHVFPVWLGFRGGKGVATALGVFACLTPVLPILIVLVIFVAVVWATRYVSLGSITAAAAFPICVWMWSSSAGRDLGLTVLTPVRVAAVVASLFVIAMHRRNITRLLRGTESKLKM